MKVYCCMVEHRACTNVPPCGGHLVATNKCDHPQELRMSVDGKISTKKTGPAQRAGRAMSTNKNARFYTGTGHALVMEAEVGEWKPLLSDTEQAALRVGGPEAVRKIQAQKDREALKAAHRQDTDAPSLCICSNPWPCKVIRPPKIVHAYDPSKDHVVKSNNYGYGHAAAPTTVTYRYCVCGKNWDSKCSKLKSVIQAAERAKARAG